MSLASSRFLHSGVSEPRRGKRRRGVFVSPHPASRDPGYNAGHTRRSAVIKSLLILLLALGLFLALFLTRPTKADFEKYVRETTTVVDGKPTGGKTILDTIGEKMKTFSAS